MNTDFISVTQDIQDRLYLYICFKEIALSIFFPTGLWIDTLTGLLLIHNLFNLCMTSKQHKIVLLLIETHYHNDILTFHILYLLNYFPSFQ